MTMLNRFSCNSFHGETDFSGGGQDENSSSGRGPKKRRIHD
ncbi:hypothetical protein M8C21_001658 [Ambrosia artemisiifolia]|uniref:Uncharacterized protein n=1 Tax=Ambrosia artemisiifolia TaxID=4212 RepID=A0AAD5C216_AMBAR|nr:hypothetical protein M8C21_001658 [Ambrosia artemisiifolia]